MKKIKYVLAAIALTMIMFVAATGPQVAVAQENNSTAGQNYYGQSGG